MSPFFIFFFFPGSEPKHPAVARSTREEKQVLLEQVRAPESVQAQVWSQLSREPESSRGFAFSKFPLVFTGRFCHSLVICPPSGSAVLCVHSSGLALLSGAVGLGKLQSWEPMACRQQGLSQFPMFPVLSVAE